MTTTRLNPQPPRIISGTSSVTFSSTHNYNGHYLNSDKFMEFGQDIGTTNYVVQVTPITSGMLILSVRQKNTNGVHLLISNVAASSAYSNLTIDIDWTVHLL